ncbi:MAG: hypothetical protein RR840_01925 [Clostridium sp.]
MSKNKKMIPILLAASLTVAVIPITSSYAEESLGFGFNSSNISSKIINDNINIKKVDREDGSGFTNVIETFNKSSRNTINENQAKDIALTIFTNYCSINVSSGDSLSLRKEDNDYIVSIKGDKRYIRIANNGLIKAINAGKVENNHSANYSKDINRSKDLVEKFLDEYLKEEKDSIRTVLTTENNNSGNYICFNLQRYQNNIKVLGEGGSIIIDASDYTIKGFNLVYNEIGFEKETFSKLSKEKAIGIVEASSQNGSKYIKNKDKYELDFSLRDNRDYLIDVKSQSLKDDIFNEYTIEGNINIKKKIKESLKDISEGDKTSENIVSGLTGYKVNSVKTSSIKENKRELLRSEVTTEEGIIYYVEYSLTSLQFLNVYQFGYDTVEKKKSPKIGFEKAYKSALSTIGFLYGSKIDRLTLSQSESDMKESTVYTFTFNRIEDSIPVDGQYISINIDAKTGQVLSSLIEWSGELQLEKANKRYIQKKRRDYLEKLKGQYVYINENNRGKLYYKLATVEN